jgi:hypothetical protein
VVAVAVALTRSDIRWVVEDPVRFLRRLLDGAGAHTALQHNSHVPRLSIVLKPGDLLNPTKAAGTQQVTESTAVSSHS